MIEGRSWVSTRSFICFTVALRSILQNYPSFVYMFADLEQLTKAELFVGTFSSNVGRLVALLREAAGKSRQSAISIDGAWLPGRA